GKVPVPLPSVTATTPLIESFANKSTYTGKPIDPPSTEHWDIDKRALPHTSKLARELAEVAADIGLPLSPLRAEALIIGYTAAVGKTVLKASDTLLPGGSPRPPKGIADVPLIGPFFPRMPVA